MNSENEKKILIVDDNPQNLQVLGDMLRSNGYKLTFAMNGKQAYEYCLKSVPDLILMDIMMPEMDGLEATKLIKENKVTKSIPVIFVTALTETQNKLDAFRIGGEDYITKPFFQEEVLARVNVVLEKESLIKKLNHSRQMYQKLFNSAPVPFVVIDGKKNIIQCNNEFKNIVNFDLDHLDFMSVIEESYKSNFIEIIEKNQIDQEIEPFECKLVDKEGDIIDVLIDIKQIVYDSIMCSQLVFTDISKLKEIDRMKNLFISTASHEMRTPLTSIIGYADTLSSYDDIDSETQKEFLSYILEEGNRLSYLIENMLDLSKLDGGKATFYKENIDIVSVLKTVVKRYISNELNVNIKFDENLSVSTLYADYEKLIQVFDNILSNAIKYSTEDGNIEIKVDEIEDKLEISISDNGVGISAKALPNIFDRFYRDSKTERTYRGTGLGLAITKEIVENHSGVIDIMSKVNEGTTVKVSLPLKNNPEAK